jgi:hypothetical protein
MTTDRERSRCRGTSCGFSAEPRRQLPVADGERAMDRGRRGSHPVVRARSLRVPGVGGRGGRRPGRAAAQYAEAIERWRAFRRVPELAYALLGRGRCLRQLGDDGAEDALSEARELFSSFGYGLATAEVD